MVTTATEFYEAVNEVLDTACELVEFVEQDKGDEEIIKASTKLGIVVREYRRLKEVMEGDTDGVLV